MEEGSQQGCEVDISEAVSVSATIGSAMSCPLHIQGNGVKPVHAKLFVRRGSLMLMDLSFDR